MKSARRVQVMHKLVTNVAGERVLDSGAVVRFASGSAYQIQPNGSVRRFGGVAAKGKAQMKRLKKIRRALRATPQGGASVPASLPGNQGGASVPASLPDNQGGASVPASLTHNQ